MPEIPFPLTGETLPELREQIAENLRVLFEDRIAGAEIGDTFTITSGTITLTVSSTSGLETTGNELSIKLNGTSLELGADGLKVGQSAHIADASTSHTIAGGGAALESDVQDALDALGTKINAIFALLEARGLQATS
jgi:hypothetical protein